MAAQPMRTRKTERKKKTPLVVISLVYFGLQRHSTWNGCSTYENEVNLKTNQEKIRKKTTPAWASRSVQGLVGLKVWLGSRSVQRPEPSLNLVMKQLDVCGVGGCVGGKAVVWKLGTCVVFYMCNKVHVGYVPEIEETQNGS